MQDRMARGVAGRPPSELLAGANHNMSGDEFRNRTPALTVAREALKRGPLVRDGINYLSGRRRFYYRTIDKLIASGEAVRVGTGVVHADHLQTREAAE